MSTLDRFDADPREIEIAALMAHCRTLVALVRELRAAQRFYYKTRTPEALIAAKSQEAALDRVLERFPS